MGKRVSRLGLAGLGRSTGSARHSYLHIPACLVIQVNAVDSDPMDDVALMAMAASNAGWLPALWHTRRPGAFPGRWLEQVRCLQE